MERREQRARVASRGTSAVPMLLFVGALVSTLAACTQAGTSAYERTVDARHRTASLETQFTKAVEASNRAVLADTDASSAQFAREAETARAAVKRAESELAVLLRDLAYGDESKLLHDFHGKFAAYEILDRSILQLAVEKTNLKALRLSFAGGNEAAVAFKNAVREVGGTGADALRTRALALEAVSAVSEIQLLEAPHVAQASDAAMTDMEQAMARYEANARASLTDLAGLVAPEKLALASAALERFVAVNGEIVALSRRNTDVRSLDMTLGEKRTMVATCQESLRALSEALTERLTRPTR